MKGRFQALQTYFILTFLIAITGVGAVSSAIAQSGSSSDPQFTNGVAHSELYPGNSLDVRVNACISDAEKGANGATSHICSSEGESATNEILATISVGDAASDSVTWVLPSFCKWQVISSDSFTGTRSAIEQYSQSVITGRGGHYACGLTNDTGSKSLFAIYEALPSANYVRASNFTVTNSANSTASGAAFLIEASKNTSVFQDIEVLQYVPYGVGIQIGGMGKPCCAASLNRMTVQNNNIGGSPLSIIGNSAGGANGVIISNSSFGQPARGQPVISCTDTSEFFVTLFLNNIYEEGALGDLTTPLNEVNGCRSIHVSGMELKVESATNGMGPAWQLNGSNPTSFDIQGLSMQLGFALPSIAVQNNLKSSCAAPPCNIMTDTKGYLSAYSNGVTPADEVNVLSGYEVNGAPLSFSNLAGSLSLPSQLPYATNSAVGAMRGDGSTITCSAGVCSAVSNGGGTVTGSGAPGAIPKWTTTINQTNSALSDDGTTVSSSEPMVVAGSVSATLVKAPTVLDTSLSVTQCVATDSTGALTTAGGPCQIASTETVAFSATPVFLPNVGSSRIVVSGNIASFTLAAGVDGQHKCLDLVHDATSTVYKVTPPTNVGGFFTIGSVASKHNLQCYTYFLSDGAWLAESPGTINQ